MAPRCKSLQETAAGLHRNIKKPCSSLSAGCERSKQTINSEAGMKNIFDVFGFFFFYFMILLFFFFRCVNKTHQGSLTH